MTIKHDGLDVSWLGYATVRIESPDGFVVYFDPGATASSTTTTPATAI